MKLINKIREIDEKYIQWLALSVFILQPLLELDYLAYDFLNRFGIPRLSTVFHMLVIPLIVLIVFIYRYRENRKTIYVFVAYLAVLGIWFVLHCINAAEIYPELYLTTNFYFSIFQEFTYVFTLVIPYFMIYTLFRADITADQVRKSIVGVSLFISVLVVSGDLFLFGNSTYNPGHTKANILVWFTDYLDVYHPRDLSSKFYFPEGNTLGIYQFIILPLLYYYLNVARERKEQILMIAAILLQSLAMVMLATRVATYGTILMPALSLAIYLLFVIMKKVRFRMLGIVFSLLMTLAFWGLLKYTPAYINSQLDNANDVAVLNDNYLLEKGIADFEKATEGLVPGSAEYNYFYIYYFEDSGIRTNLISSVSKEYYLDYYNYKFDAKFWWDVLNLPLEQRVNGRQIETIFNEYKWNTIGSYTKLMGMGYSTFMNGSLLVEQDFVQQKYTLGYIGDFITMAPWLLTGIYGLFLIVRDIKNRFNYRTVSFAVSYCAGLGASYMSGHTLDQYLTTTLMALVVAVLLKECLKEVD